VVSKEKSRKQTLTALVSITLQVVVPIYKGFVNLITNSFKTQVTSHNVINSWKKMRKLPLIGQAYLNNEQTSTQSV
jgi:hypothetical protein